MVSHSFRSLARSPGFTATAVLTLALGIGATTAIFGVIDTVMLRPLDYPQPERLVRVWETTPEGDDFVASDPNYLDFREQNRSFEALAAFKQASLSLTGSGEPRRLEGMAITHDLFPLLGVQPELGRGFRAEEDRPGGDARVVLLGHTREGDRGASLPLTAAFGLRRTRTATGVDRRLRSDRLRRRAANPGVRGSARPRCHARRALTDSAKGRGISRRDVVQESTEKA